MITPIPSIVFISFRAVRKPWSPCMRLHPERVRNICCVASRRPSPAHRSVFGGVPADCREILLPLMTDQLKFHLEKEEELQACCQLLSDILEVLYRKDVVRNMIFFTILMHFIALWCLNTNSLLTGRDGYAQCFTAETEERSFFEKKIPLYSL